jgi:hypothetical protein
MRKLIPIFFLVLLALLIGVGPARGDASAPVRVELQQHDGRWQLLRDGEPYFIKGGGGDGSPSLLAACGGNSIRTWSVDDLGKRLDEAQANGLTVAVGLWLGHPEQGFDYNDAGQVEAQTEAVRQAVLKYRNHPAVLVWGLGNEMEMQASDNAAIWSHIGSLAAMVHQLDPNHPTMTVIAEIGGRKVQHINQLCPQVDIIGINTYAGLPTLPARYKEAGGTKPYVVTEFGPPGYWESPKTAYGAALELSSTQKAEKYREGYEKGIVQQPGLCLGSYAFIWGHKIEATPTWFGILLPDGTRLGVADVLAEEWSGHPPANRCPTIDSLKLQGSDDVGPGDLVHAELNAADPDHDPIEVKWVLQRDLAEFGVDADSAADLAAVVKSDHTSAEVKMPAGGGTYRLYAYVTDKHGGAATANVPLHVKGPVELPAARKPTSMPVVVFDEAARDSVPYVPSGWMGDTKSIKVDPRCEDQPHAGKTCIRVDFTQGKGWGGVVWQSPDGDWGDRAGGLDLAGAKKLTFWARGQKGGEEVSFELGLIGHDKRFFDTANAKLKTTLTAEWKQYSIDLSGKDLSRIKTGFCWTVAASGEPITFFLDDIQYE